MKLTRLSVHLTPMTTYVVCNIRKAKVYLTLSVLRETGYRTSFGYTWDKYNI